MTGITEHVLTVRDGPWRNVDIAWARSAWVGLRSNRRRAAHGRRPTWAIARRIKRS